MPDPPTIAVCADPSDDSVLLKTAARLSVDLQLPFLEKPKQRGWEILLVVTPARLEVRVIGGDKALRGGRAIAVELDKLDITSPAGRRLKQPLAKAVGIKSLKTAPSVIDATAGFGQDAWILASLHCHVLAVERNRIIATLLRDGVLRMGGEHCEIVQRVHVVTADARHLLRRLSRHELLYDLPDSVQRFLEPDVVYIDPMFPTGRKAAERKPMRVLRRIAGDDEDAAELLHHALKVAMRRVVVKRPLRAEPLGGREPTTSHKGAAMRYDVYVTSR